MSNYKLTSDEICFVQFLANKYKDGYKTPQAIARIDKMINMGDTPIINKHITTGLLKTFISENMIDFRSHLLKLNITDQQRAILAQIDLCNTILQKLKVENVTSLRYISLLNIIDELKGIQKIGLDYSQNNIHTNRIYRVTFKKEIDGELYYFSLELTSAIPRFEDIEFRKGDHICTLWINKDEALQRLNNNRLISNNETSRFICDLLNS